MGTAQPGDRRIFCTLFDSAYLVKALALYRSLEATCPAFHLIMYCFDEPSREIVERLELPDATAIPLHDLEAADPEFLRVRPTRSHVEYMWTATPVSARHVLTAGLAEHDVTYLDADVYFFSSPEPLFEELGTDSILLTPHRFAPEHRRLLVRGIFNVQFVTFRNDEHGRTALDWWRERCIEWCYARIEPTRMGDQKYLDDWPERFAGVHVLDHLGGGLGPWNVAQYDLENRDGQLEVNRQPVVFYHFHRVTMRAPGSYRWRPPAFKLGRLHHDLLYAPYFSALDDALAQVRRVKPDFDAGIVPRRSLTDVARDWRSHLLRRVIR